MAQVVTYYPRYRARGGREPLLDVAHAEALLTEWFGREVVLFASGRSALVFYLKMLGWQRYRHRLVVPLYLSRCVLTAITRVAFPVHLPERGDAVLLYHQFGWPQLSGPCAAPVLEDIAHNFFATEHTGRRRWGGEVALFSLPKFFGLAGSAGGLVIERRAVAARVRAERVRSPEIISSADRTRVRRLARRAYAGKLSAREQVLLDAGYELLTQAVSPTEADIRGLPRRLDHVRRVGEERAERCLFVRSFFGGKAWPGLFWPASGTVVPFAVPYFLRTATAAPQLQKALERLGWPADVYHVDVHRSMRRPHFRPALLLPCHQDVPLSLLREACSTIHHYDRQ